MEIRKMTADFGTLNHGELEPGPGLTIIHAPNESGKSTWCAFIRAMLYGIDTSEREKGGVKPDKAKYLPWSGMPMAGTMELTHAGREITMTRKSRGNAPMREFSAVYSGTGEPVPGLQGTTAGETLTGVSRDVFARTAFVRQAGLSVSGSPELEKRISAIVSTGEESDSYTDADEKLRSWQRKRRYNRRGAIPELEKQMEEQTRLLQQLRSAAAEAERAEAMIPARERRVVQLQAEVQEARKQQRKQALARMSENSAKVKGQEARLEEARQAHAVRQQALAASPFAGMQPEQAVSEAKAAAEQAKLLTQRAETVMKPTLWILLAVLAVIGLAVGAVVPVVPVLIAGLVFLAAAVFVFLRFQTGKKQAAAALAELGPLLGKYGASTPEELPALAEEYQKQFAAAEQADRAAANAQTLLETLREEKAASDAVLVNQLNDLDSGSGPAAALNRAQAELLQARETAAMTRGRLDTLGDPLVIESQLRELESRKQSLEMQYEALSVAIDTLGQANTEIQTRFSPQLGKRASELMHRLTGGRYDQLALDRQLNAQARREGDTAAHEAAYLSAGALDQLYLALRLAICELALPQDEPCPLILDDALVNFDDERMALALELLVEMSRQRQILLFTCHSRERDYFAGKEGVTVIAL